jgi:DNA-binding transcriptional MerR regulator/SAM-dependent methyltransferase
MAEFLKATGLRIDAARYYIAMGLFVPSKRNGKFVFSLGDVRDAQNLLTLLHLGATLQEAKPVLFAARVTGEPIEENDTFRALLPELIARAKGQKDHDQKREAELSAFLAPRLSQSTLRGFPLSAILSLCPEGSLSSERVVHNEVLTGAVELPGQSLPIRYGILCDGTSPRLKEDKTTLSTVQDFGDYLQSMPKESVSQVDAFFVALEKEIAALSGSNLLIDNADGSDSLGGLLSRYPGKQIVLWGGEDITRPKHVLDESMSRPIAYLCSTKSMTPFLSESFDGAVDFFSSDIHTAHKGEDFLPELARLLKPKGQLVLCKIIAPGGPLASEADFLNAYASLFTFQKVYESTPFVRSAWDFNFFPYAAEAKISLAIYLGQRRLTPR